ncbi:MAG TPA: DUF3090 domain-containing protein [Anaerolineaceae bacterium]
MPKIEIDLNPTDRITVDAIGQPGQRVFYIQGRKDEEVITLVAEKIQIQTLASGIEDFLGEISRRFPDLPEATGEYDEEAMRIIPPVEPLFRVGELGLAYDSDHDMMVLVAREILAGESDPEEASTVRFWCTRSQMLALGHWGLEVASHGRAICPLCGQPIDPEGHFCPKKNGHKH